MGRNWENSWRTDVGPAVTEVLLAGQEASAASTEQYVAAVLAELGIASEVPTSLNVDALVGVTGDGRPVASMAYGAVINAAKASYSPDLSGLNPEMVATRSLASAEAWIEQAAATLMADAVRAAEVASTAQRPWVTGYVRMVSGGACSRCVILAGKHYRYNTGFLRHPKCQCRHIPASEDVAGDMLTNPSRYFDSLSKAEQDRVFTGAGAEAIRLGADPSQVVNARRGMRTAQVYGRKALVTTEGTTARGVAGKTLGELNKIAGQRYRVSRTPRLMPETVIAQATSPEDALRLLKRFGYVI